MKFTRSAIIGFVASCIISSVSVSHAQLNGPPNALQGFSQNRNQPVKINANALEVRDKSKVATFLGDVHLVQGDTTMRCKTLVVYYDGEATPGAAQTSSIGSGSNQQIRRMEAKGGVIVTQKDQTASGDNGEFDMKSNTVTLTGNVLISQGQNVVKGDRLTVNLTSGVSRVECGKSSQCRVGAVIVPNSTRGNGGNRSSSTHQPPRLTPTGPGGLY